MSQYEEFSNVKVVLQEVLESLDEQREYLTSRVLRDSEDATDGAVRQMIGEVNGLDKAIARLRYNFGADRISETMPDTRY